LLLNEFRNDLRMMPEIGVHQNNVIT
jgi:hypothetical protein